DDQAIQTILLGLLEDIYAAVDSCETTKEIWLRVQQMMKGSDIGIQEKKAKLFNEWERQIAQPGMNMGQDGQMQMVRGNGKNQFRQYARQNVGNLNGYNANENGNLVAAHAERNAAGHNGNQIRCYNCRVVGHFARNYTGRPRRRDAAYLHTQLLIAQKKEAGIQLQAEEFDLMAAAADLDEIEEVNANCILMANMQQASTSGTQTDKAPVYDLGESAEVHDYENCNDNEIFNMFTQEEQYTELLEPIPKPHQVPLNDNNVISNVTSVEQSGETVEQHPVNFEETRALYDSLYQNLAIEVEKVNKVNRKLKETNAELTTELARFKNQEMCFEISQDKYDKLERIDNTKTRRPQPRSNTQNDRDPSTSKSSRSKNKGVEVKEHHRNLLLSKNKKHMSFAWQFCDSDLEVAFRRNACFVRNLEGVDLLKGDSLSKLYAINLHEMASASPICLMARASSTKTKKIIETMNVSFDELSAMAFEQRSLKPGLQSMTFGQISSGLDLTYVPSTITTQQPTEGELDLLFEAMYDDFIGGQLSAAQRTVPAVQAQQVRQTSTTSTSKVDSAPTPTNSSPQATNFPNTSQDVDELNSQQQHV
nr:integrase, catalytic region, zinc finger, CCHC-type, peptidase aspartic, catalytic [Tanacetum cinerariifolium]